MEEPRGKKKLSVIIPVHNDAENLAICLDAFHGSFREPDEIIVLDDGSTDASGAVAARHPGVQVVTFKGDPRGPAYVRNRGSEKASGDLLLFMDSDVRIHADTLSRMEAVFDANPEISAAFGSYDDTPWHPGLVSRFKNLLHHFVHQHGKEDTSTFWAGCGAIRKHVFDAVGGFDATFPDPSIEDIELGGRLIEKGYKIRLCRDVLVTHLKKWTLLKWMNSDILGRAVPWTRLILMRKKMPNDLNLKMSSRISAVLIWVFILSLFSMIWEPRTGLVVLACSCGLIALNMDLWKFFYRKGGVLFMMSGFFLYGFYLFYSSLIFMLLYGKSLLIPHSRA